MTRNGTFIAVGSVLVVIFLMITAVYMFWSDMRTEKEMAPDFSYYNEGNETSLGDLSGKPIILHFTNIENPICIECEKELKGQVTEISKAVSEDEDLVVITVNMRKNRYSDPGYTLAYEWWGVNVTWIWIEEPDPFPISGKYVDYWSIGSESANPTLLLLDEERYIVGIYHIYQMGKGEVDGILSSEEILEKVAKVRAGDWKGVEGQKSSLGTGSYFGMFVLGIVTSFSPCSIALLFTVFTFILSARSKDEGGKSHSSGEGFVIGISFVAGMAFVFFLLGLFIARLGVFVQNARFFDLVAGGILVLLGMNNLFDLTSKAGDLKDRLFKKGHSSKVADKGIKERSISGIKGVFGRSPVLGALLLGIFFSLGWAPCAVSLVLPVVVWILSQDVSILMSGTLFFVFGIGHGLLFVPLAIGTTTFAANLTQRFVSLGKWVKMIFGFIVVAMGFIFMVRVIGFKLW